MKGNPLRAHISKLMKEGAAANDPLGDQLDRELSEMDENQGPLTIAEKADNADAIVRERQRSLANVGFVSVMHPDAAEALMTTAYDIASVDEVPEEKEARKTYVSAHRMLQSLFRYYSDEDEDRK